MKATIKEHILLLLSIKKEGKLIDFDHIYEKVKRDSEESLNTFEFENILKNLENEKLIFKSNKKYKITQNGQDLIKKRLNEINNLNKSYRMVYQAKNYYRSIAKLMLPFLRGRAVSVIKIFSDEKDPLKKIKPSFVRYAKYRPKPIPIQINSEKELMNLVDQHAIDFIPYVHKLNSDMPDWFILDLDAGNKYKEYTNGFNLLKIVAKNIYDLLIEFEVKPAIKFSGSRGIQIWCSFSEHDLPMSYSDYFSFYRALVVFIQSECEKRLQKLPKKVLKEFYKVTKEGKSITTSQIAKKKEREDQILVDNSTIKPSGDVRSPYSIHYKTSLVSCPIYDLEKFQIGDAKIDNVLKKIRDFDLRKCDGELLFNAFLKEEKNENPI